jgi:hypothetical protein
MNFSVLYEIVYSLYIWQAKTAGICWKTFAFLKCQKRVTLFAQNGTNWYKLN